MVVSSFFRSKTTKFVIFFFFIAYFFSPFISSQPRHNHLRNRPQVFITPQCAFNNDCIRFRNSTCNWLSRRCQCPFGQIFVTTEKMVKKGVTLNNLNMSTVLCEPAHCRPEECRHRFKLGDGARCNEDTGLCECRPGEGTIHLATNTCTYTGFKMPWWKILICSIFGLLIFGAIVSSCLVFWKRRLDNARKRCASSQLKLDSEKKNVDSVF